MMSKTTEAVLTTALNRHPFVFQPGEVRQQHPELKLSNLYGTAEYHAKIGNLEKVTAGVFKAKPEAINEYINVDHTKRPLYRRRQKLIAELQKIEVELSA